MDYHSPAMNSIWVFLAVFVIFQTKSCYGYGSDPTFLAAPVMNSEILCDLLGSFNFSSMPMYERILPLKNSTHKRIILEDLQKCLGRPGDLQSTHESESIAALLHCNNVTLMKHNESSTIESNFGADVELQRMQWLFEFKLKTNQYFPKKVKDATGFRLLCYNATKNRIKECVTQWLDFNETDSMCTNFDVVELCFNLVYKEYCNDTNVAFWLQDFRNVLECPPAERIYPVFPSNMLEVTRALASVLYSYTSFKQKISGCLAKRNVTLNELHFCISTYGGDFKKPTGPSNTCKDQWTNSIVPCMQNQRAAVREASEECYQLIADNVKWEFGHDTFQLICSKDIYNGLKRAYSHLGMKVYDDALVFTDILCFREMKAQLSPGEASICKYYEIFHYCTQKSANQFFRTSQYPKFRDRISKTYLKIAGCTESADDDVLKNEEIHELQRHVKLLVNAVGNVSQVLTLLPKVFEMGKKDGCGFKAFSSKCYEEEGSKEITETESRSRGTTTDVCVCEEDQSCWRSIEEDMNRCYPAHTGGTLVAKFHMAYRGYLCDHFSQFLKLENGALNVGATPLPCHEMLEASIGNCTDSEIIEKYTTNDVSICVLPKVIKECVQKFYTDDCDNPDATSLVVGLVANISHQLECQKESNDESSSFLLVNIGVTAAASAVLIIGVILGIVSWKLKQARKHILSERERNYFLNGKKFRNPNVKNGDSNEAILSKDMDPSDLPYDKTKYEIPENALKLDESNVLGEGNFGKVIKGTVERNGNGTLIDVAVKTLKQDGIEKSYLMSLLTEIKIMMYIGEHPNIVTFVGAVTKNIMKGDILMVSEFCPLGNLLDHLREGRKTFVNQIVDGEFLMTKCGNVYENLSANRMTSGHLLKWAFQVAKGMLFLAEKKVIHSDLASRNVLLTKDGIAKITDFGLSRKLYQYSQYVKKSREPLPWRWMAPESLVDLTFTPHSDIWSYGIFLWEVFTLGSNPFANCHWSDEFISELRNGFRPPHPCFATLGIYKDVILECWRFEAEERIRFIHICEYLHALKSTFDYEQKESQFPINRAPLFQ